MEVQGGKVAGRDLSPIVGPVRVPECELDAGVLVHHALLPADAVHARFAPHAGGNCARERRAGAQGAVHEGGGGARCGAATALSRGRAPPWGIHGAQRLALVYVVPGSSAQGSVNMSLAALVSSSQTYVWTSLASTEFWSSLPSMSELPSEQRMTVVYSLPPLPLTPRPASRIGFDTSTSRASMEPLSSENEPLRTEFPH